MGTAIGSFQNRLLGVGFETMPIMRFSQLNTLITILTDNRCFLVGWCILSPITLSGNNSVCKYSKTLVMKKYNLTPNHMK